uniref:Uncharacterized protein n=1 Tax=Arundo donax TaxID=35708 RepID=A0A0A9E4N5_ARUDO
METVHPRRSGMKQVMRSSSWTLSPPGACHAQTSGIQEDLEGRTWRQTSSAAQRSHQPDGAQSHPWRQRLTQPRAVV